MKYTYTTLLLAETGAEINERNVTAVLEAADADVTASRVKATIAALEGVDVEEHAARPDARSDSGDDGPRPPDAAGDAEDGSGAAPPDDGPDEVKPVVASDEGDGRG